MSFREKWLAAVERKNSVLCAGLDPAEFEMGRDEEGLLAGIDKSRWSIDYIAAIAPYCVAIKQNVQYWKARFDMIHLDDLTRIAHQHDLLVIDDSKLADIGSTNDAGMYHTMTKGMDAITLACFAGNMKEASEQLQKRNLGGIHMCLMSNPEYAREKNKLVPLAFEDVGHYDASDMVLSESKDAYVKQYIQLAVDAKRYGLEGVVVGAPSKKNHITEEELQKVRQYVGEDMLVLLPGLGVQGGEAGIIWRHYNKNNVIVNVGRDLMFSKGSATTFEQHRERAKYYQEMLNMLRTAG